ncbi:MAG: hypothetical protein Q9169_006056 [Polycauliona sp. 2 TL-2023]
MINTSPYGLIQSAPPEWRPQEDRAASAFVGISFFLFLETIFEIFRVFKKRQGLYFWSLLIGVICLPINNIAVLLKYLVPDTQHIWPLYTLAALVSWSLFTIAQLLVLYSRLHLVVENARIQRWVLYLIIACGILFVIPSWIVVWPAWNPDPEMTHRWSPPDGIVERFTQLGFTLAECIISGIYIHALWRLLGWKPTVRQRRVFLDLVYVNVITILFDILSTLLVYLNQTGMSHPIQVFSYSLKFRLEFVVLNQLMAVAARGIRRETFGEKRYHRDSGRNNSYYHQGFVPSEPIGGSPQYDGRALSKGNGEISIPDSVLEQINSRSTSDQSSKDGFPLPLQGQRSTPADESTTVGTRRAAFRLKGLVNAMRPGSRSADIDVSTKANEKTRSNRSTGVDEDDGYEEEIPIHLWERNGEIIMRVPWLQGNDQRQV